jgi:hypothetical protein
MQYLKYEFANQASWLEKKATIWAEESGYSNCHVVELGDIVLTPGTYDEEGNVVTPPVTSGKFAVDILWNEEEDSSFTSFQVWPSPTGVHTFAGLEYLYEEGYYAKYPELKPVITINE